MFRGGVIFVRRFPFHQCSLHREVTRSYLTRNPPPLLGTNKKKRKEVEWCHLLPFFLVVNKKKRKMSRLFNGCGVAQTSWLPSLPHDREGDEKETSAQTICFQFYAPAAHTFLGELMGELKYRQSQVDALCDKQFQLTHRFHVGTLDTALDTNTNSQFTAEDKRKGTVVLVVPTDTRGRLVLPSEHYAQILPDVVAIIQSAIEQVASVGRRQNQNSDDNMTNTTNKHAAHLDVGAALFVYDVLYFKKKGDSKVETLQDDPYSFFSPVPTCYSLESRMHMIICPIVQSVDHLSQQTSYLVHRHAYHAMHATVSILLSSLATTLRPTSTAGSQTETHSPIFLFCPPLIANVEKDICAKQIRTDSESKHTRQPPANTTPDTRVRHMVDAMIVAFMYGRDYDVGMYSVRAGHIQALTHRRIRAS